MNHDLSEMRQQQRECSGFPREPRFGHHNQVQLQGEGAWLSLVDLHRLLVVDYRPIPLDLLINPESSDPHWQEEEVQGNLDQRHGQ